MVNFRNIICREIEPINMIHDDQGPVIAIHNTARVEDFVEENYDDMMTVRPHSEWEPVQKLEIRLDRRLRPQLTAGLKVLMSRNSLSR